MLRSLPSGVRFKYNAAAGHWMARSYLTSDSLSERWICATLPCHIIAKCSQSPAAAFDMAGHEREGKKLNLPWAITDMLRTLAALSMRPRICKRYVSDLSCSISSTIINVVVVTYLLDGEAANTLLVQMLSTFPEYVQQKQLR